MPEHKAKENIFLSDVVLNLSDMSDRYFAPCVDALCEVESQSKITDIIIQRQPQPKSLVCQSRWVAICAMTALLKLVAHEQSGKPTSLAKYFESILDQDGISQMFSLYK